MFDNPFKQIVACLFMIGIGWMLFRNGFKKLKIKKKVLSLATSKIRSLSMGTVEINGKAEIKEDMQDPIFHSPCAYYHIKLEKYRQSGRSGHWVTIYEDDTGTIPFFCGAHDGRVIIWPKKAELFLNNQIKRKIGGFSSSDAVVNFMTSKGGSMSRLKLTADIVRPGDPLYIMGHAEPLPSSISNHPTVTEEEVTKLLNQDKATLAALDQNKDGQIDSMEWEMGIQKLKKELIAQKLKEQNETNPSVSKMDMPKTLVTCGPDFNLVMATTEKDLLNKLGRFCLLNILGGGALLIVGLIFLFDGIRLISGLR